MCVSTVTHTETIKINSYHSLQWLKKYVESMITSVCFASQICYSYNNIFMRSEIMLACRRYICVCYDTQSGSELGFSFILFLINISMFILNVLHNFTKTNRNIVFRFYSLTLYVYCIFN